MTVTKVERLRVNVIADVLELSQPASIWENFLPSIKVPSHPTLLTSVTTAPSNSPRKGYSHRRRIKSKWKCTPLQAQSNIRHTLSV